MSSTTSAPASRAQEKGQVLVLFAGGLVLLLIVAALAFDVGMMLLERRDEQNAADAAALAGARYVLTDGTAAEAAARRIARDNGYDDADPDEVVNVYIPPIHGRYVGFPGFIEVQIQSTRPSIFGGVIGQAAWPTGAFAVATNKQDLSFPFSMLALNPTACKAIAVSGTGEVNATGTIQSNSSGTGCGGTDPAGWVSFSRTGGSTINVGDDVYCRAFGAFLDQGSGAMDCTKDPNKFALPDPMAGLPEPTRPALAPDMLFIGPGTEPADQPKYCPGRGDRYAPVATDGSRPCDLGAAGYTGFSWVLYPGLYPGGLSVDAGTTAYLLPGVYWIGGNGITVQNGGSIVSIDPIDLLDPATWPPVDPATLAWENPVRTNPLLPANGQGGVLIYNSDDPTPGGAIKLDSSAAIMKLMPLDVSGSDPNSIYNQIVFFQDRSLSTSITLNGSSSNTIVAGLIYAPQAQVKLNGNGGTLTVGQVIADTFDINGNGGTIYVTDDDLFEAVIKAAGLVD